jgi:hypothetical protein
MKKLILDYLNTTYPNAYLKQTKFGSFLCGYNEDDSNWLGMKRNILETTQRLFSCDFATADEVLIEWAKSRPLYVSTENSTNEIVLVPATTELNTTA